MKIKFSELDKEIQIGRCTIPHAVFATSNPDDETIEQVMERQEKFLKLPEDIKNKLVSRETAEKIKAIGAHYNLELLQMAPIARVIRNYYFKEVSLDDFANIISRESNINLVDAQNIARYVTERIINQNAVEAPKAQTIKMTIAQAVAKYPEINGQILTSYPIEVNGLRVRPTIESWRNDYLSTVGLENRDVIKRSSYLYHSKNVKNLNIVDRQKLSEILKSLDENFLLEIDPVKKMIIFSEKEINKTSSLNNNLVNREINKPVNENIKTMAKDGEPRSRELNSVSQKNIQSNATQDLEKAPNNRDTIIKHVQGNSWDLKSSHFIKRDDFDNKINGIENSSIKFSSPQQLPVEKENKSIDKSGRFKNFFGKIEPIE